MTSPACPVEIREFEAKASSDQKPGTAEVKLAEQLIDSISSPAFDAKAYHDEYRERVMELIEEKTYDHIYPTTDL